MKPPERFRRSARVVGQLETYAVVNASKDDFDLIRLSKGYI